MPKCKKFILLLELCWFCQKFCISAWGSPVGLLHHLAQPIVPGLPRPCWSVWPTLCAAPCAVIYMATRVLVLFIEESWGLWHVSNALQAVVSVHKASSPRHNGSPYKWNPQSICVLLDSQRMNFLSSPNLVHFHLLSAETSLFCNSEGLNKTHGQ